MVIGRYFCWTSLSYLPQADLKQRWQCKSPKWENAIVEGIDTVQQIWPSQRKFVNQYRSAENAAIDSMNGGMMYETAVDLLMYAAAAPHTPRVASSLPNLDLYFCQAKHIYYVLFRERECKELKDAS